MLTRTEDGFTVEKKEICDAIYGDDSAFIVEMLEECGFVKEGTPSHFTDDSYMFAYVVLTAAAAAEAEDALTEEMAGLIIGYLSGVTTATLLEFVYHSTYYDIAEDFGPLPKKLRKAICKNRFSNETAGAIKDLSKEEFIVLLCYLTSSEVKRLDYEFAMPILESVYHHKLISPCLFFAYMAASLKEPDRETPSAIRCVISVLPGSEDDDDDEKSDKSESEDDSEDDHADESGCCGGGCGGCCGGCHGGCGGCHGGCGGCGHCGTSDNK